jgi:hypothetical protein
MRRRPIRKFELELMEAMARAVPLSVEPEEATYERLAQIGMVERRAGKWLLTERAKMDLQRRKALERKRKR